MAYRRPRSTSALTTRERTVAILVLCGVAAGTLGSGFAVAHSPEANRTAPSPLLSPVANEDSARYHGLPSSNAMRLPEMPGPRGIPAAPVLSTVNGSVVAKVNGYASPPVIAGANITAYSTTCTTSRPLPTTCPVVNETTTNLSGEFGLGLAAGSYYIAVQPDPAITGGAYPHGFGGASKEVTVPEDTEVALTVYPEVPYGNATIVLPGYLCDQRYLDDFGTGGPGCQNPVLSWTQDGAYYLNSTNELVFYSFLNRTVYAIAPWTPLFQQFPSYAMIPNDLFITQDGAYVYGWGTLRSNSANLTVEAVNVTTHRAFQYTFTGLSTSNVAANGQVDLTGWNGNDSFVTLITVNGRVYVHDLWSTDQSLVTKLDFFEANNIYWEPYLNGFVNVQAEGSTADQVEEWQLSGPTSYSLTRTFEGVWGYGRVINGVNGIALNLTDRTLSFALGAAAGGNTVVADLDPQGTITGFTTVIENPPALAQLGPGAASDRSTLLASGPALQGYYNGFYNASWLVQMTPGHLGYETTNLSGAYEYGGTPPSYGWSQWSQEGQFYNASYLIAPNSYACDTQFVDACTVNGDGGAPVGTIWWYWQLGEPEFPFPSSAPMADDGSPGPTAVTVSSLTLSSITLGWTPPSAGGVVYYSVEWGTSPSLGNSVTLPGGSDAYTISGLPSGTRVYFSVEAWNLHYRGVGGVVASAVTVGPPAPTDFAFVANNATNLSWAWTQSSGNGILNDTVFFFAGGSCGGTPRVFSTGGPSTTWTVENLSPMTLYSAYVTAWNASGQSSPSNCADGSTLRAGALVTFVESGLPTNDLWYVNVTDGPSLASSGAAPRLSVPLLNGSYRFQAATNDKTFAPAYSPIFSVNGVPLSVDVNFSLYTVPVTLSETGLPSGTEWSVTVGTVQQGTNTSTLVFLETNGTYPYAISDVSGWHQGTIPYQGWVILKGAPVTEPQLEFTRVTYTVTFLESGLGSETSWTVMVGPSVYSSTNRSVTAALPNGTFPFRLGSIGGYTEAPTNGSVYVNGTSLSELVAFTPIPVGGSPWAVGEITFGLAGTALAAVLVLGRRASAAAPPPPSPSDGPPAGAERA